MKQTIDNLNKWKSLPAAHWTDEDRYIIMSRTYKYYNVISAIRDINFMNALTSKSYLPYQAKLIALQLES